MLTVTLEPTEQFQAIRQMGSTLQNKIPSLSMKTGKSFKERETIKMSPSGESL